MSEIGQNQTESGTLEDAMQGALAVISGADMMAVKIDGDCAGQDPNVAFMCGSSDKVRITSQFLLVCIIPFLAILQIVIEADQSAKNTTIVVASARPESECIPVEEVNNNRCSKTLH